MFDNKISLLNYVLLNHWQDFADNGLCMKLNMAGGHPEFYEFGPDLIAIPIYWTPGHKRTELLTVGIAFSEEEVKVSVKELINMIKRKSLRIMNPVRRIKMKDS